MNELRMIYNLLKYSYGLFMIVVGVDKFFNFIVDWHIYVNQAILHYISYTTLNTGIAILEITLGILLLSRATRLGAYASITWLAVIIVNLLSMHNYYDIAARDVMMALGLFALAILDDVLKNKNVNARYNN